MATTDLFQWFDRQKKHYGSVARLLSDFLFAISMLSKNVEIEKK